MYVAADLNDVVEIYKAEDFDVVAERETGESTSVCSCHGAPIVLVDRTEAID